MQQLRDHERFEIELIKWLSDHGLLTTITFGGGTCLRLCFGLTRYSVDLDFFCVRLIPNDWFASLKSDLSKSYILVDAQEKYYSYFFEMKSPAYPRHLKLEIRKHEFCKPDSETELNVAFSPFSTMQVRLTTFTLAQMARNKLEAMLDRKEIRDAYDLEFLYKKGAFKVKDLTVNESKKVLRVLKSFTPRQYKVTLGHLLEKEEREYYVANGFKILINALR